MEITCKFCIEILEQNDGIGCYECGRVREGHYCPQTEHEGPCTAACGAEPGANMYQIQNQGMVVDKDGLFQPIPKDRWVLVERRKGLWHSVDGIWHRSQMSAAKSLATKFTGRVLGRSVFLNEDEGYLDID